MKRTEPQFYYEYRLLQCIPDITKEERINVGFFLMDTERGNGYFRIAHTCKMLKSLYPDINEEGFCNILAAIEKRAMETYGQTNTTLTERCMTVAGPNNSLFTWTSPRFGCTENKWKLLVRLYKEYVRE